MTSPLENFDVIVLGSGLAGSILATILAKQGLKILSIDKGSHPRFAIGEAMTPDTDLMMSILSYKFSIPELGYLSSFEGICDNISPSFCGLKRSFNFIYHREGCQQSLQEYNKVGVRSSSHLFRQEIDRYMAETAVKYGAQLLENTQIKTLKIESDGVQIETEQGESFRGQYLVDSSGYKSLLSQQFDLREKPTRFKTQSRSLFTHAIGVKNYDDCLSQSHDDSTSLAWYQGTLHHIFDGGWMWVIPFNNHERSTNPVCSIGLTLDLRRFPNAQASPEQEFKEFLGRFPGVAVQFEDAKPIRNWVQTQRLQYSSHSCAGERFYLLPHATGFIDPLYSFGLVNSCTIILPLISRILKALSENRYHREQFADVEELQQKLFDYNDDLANCSYISFRDFELWDTWRRVWLLGTFMRQMKAGLKHRLKILAGRGQQLTQMPDNDRLALLTPSYEGLSDRFFEKATETVENVESGNLTPQEASRIILAEISALDCLPNNYWKLGDSQQKNIDTESPFCRTEFWRFLSWIRTAQNPRVRQYFDYDMEDLSTLLKVPSVS
ncbi:MAG: NAD(P)/FAD-dependent oxidoreductase [Spirulina sp.]